MSSVDDYSIATISGLIAAAIILVQIILPLLFPLVLLALVGEEAHGATTSAVSWSAIGGFIHASPWPTLLASDAASIRGIPKRQVFITRLSTIMIVAVALAAILTPLGLYEIIVPSEKPVFAEFRYIPDRSPIGQGTPPRSSEVVWSRRCGWFAWTQCPNSYSNVTTIRNETGIYTTVYNLDSRVPQYLVDTFQSGIKHWNASVSSVFDIQARISSWSVVNENDPNPHDNGSRFPVAAWRQFDSFLPRQDFYLIEGLIVNLKDGGIGFRNHSLPPVTPDGSTWAEDILFVDPESHCADTNLTIDFTVPSNSNTTALPNDISNVVLTDRGGFANFLRDPPERADWDRQTNPSLQYRAWLAAWMYNALSMAFLNITNLQNETDEKPFAYVNSVAGQTFPLTGPGRQRTSLSLEAFSNNLRTSTDFGDLLRNLDKNSTGTNSTSSPRLYPNPYNINDTDWQANAYICEGYGNRANITNFAATCGFMYGVPRRSDGQSDERSSANLERGTNWTVPVYTCITAAKASIKTVHFRFNGTNDLTSLKVDAIHNKVYDNEESKPLWGVETTTNLSLADADPVWGLIDKQYRGNVSLSTLRREHLYLPGYAVDNDAGGVSSDNLPGTTFHTQAIALAYAISGSGADFQRYSGEASIAISSLWRELSGSATTASQILNLVWTDVAMNLVVGTRGIHAPSPFESSPIRRDNSLANDATYPINVYLRRVRFNFRYGVPIFFVLPVGIIIIILALVSAIKGTSNTAKLRRFLHATSAGRLVTSSEISRNKSGEAMVVMSSVKASRWAREVGKTSVTMQLVESETFPEESQMQAASDPLLANQDAGEIRTRSGKNEVGVRNHAR